MGVWTNLANLQTPKPIFLAHVLELNPREQGSTRSSLRSKKKTTNANYMNIAYCKQKLCSDADEKLWLDLVTMNDGVA
jgi:hypothetical protein